MTRHWLVYREDRWNPEAATVVKGTEPARRHGYRVEGPFVLESEDGPCNCPCCTGACTQPESKPFRQRTALDA